MLVLCSRHGSQRCTRARRGISRHSWSRNGRSTMTIGDDFRRGVRVAAALVLFSLGGVTASKAADPSAEEQKKTLSAVPADAQKYYGGYWYAGNVVADPFADWKPHAPPWQICHNDSYLGNSWRANLVAELKALTKQLADQGLAKPDLIVTNS